MGFWPQVKRGDKLMIYTSYFGGLRRLPSTMVPIAICGKVPNWYNGLHYKRLAPKKEFFAEWQKTHDNDFYIQRFYEDVLNHLTVTEVVNELYMMAFDKEICLICYERPEEFCHRHLVADWLNSNGYDCKEVT